MDLAPLSAVAPATGPTFPAAPSKVAVAFEAAMLRTFVDAMLPQEGFGEGTSGTMWRGQMADALAQKLAEGGGIGLAAMIDPHSPATSPNVKPAPSSMPSSAP